MGLRLIAYQDEYRSGRDDILEDFYKASLSEATAYWRAVGYFSSSALECFGAPLAAFAKGGGTIRLITSVELSAADIDAIQQGLKEKRPLCEEKLSEIIEREFSIGIGSGVQALASLLRLGRLEIMIAVPSGCHSGIYHEPIPII